MPQVSRDIAVASDTLDSSMPIVICIPSFRRPQHLRLTLQSLADQRTERDFAVVIVENDASERESVAVAAEFLQSGKLHGLCLVEPRQGNCQAINAAFETALTVFPAATSLMMIDDDEVASNDWLELMVQAAETTGADIVGGPVWQNFDDADKVLQRHPAFRPAYDTTGPVPIIYGCGNCLIKRPVFEKLAGPAFDLRFNFLGGGDTDFFTRCRRAGFRFHWAAEAAIFEKVPKSRTNLRWLMLRGLRIGAINYHIQRKVAQTALSQARLLAKVAAIVPLSLFRAARLALVEREPIIALHPLAVAAGGILAAAGIEPEPYKASKIS